jgi:hypothetical protein
MELYTEIHGRPISSSVINNSSQIERRADGRGLHIRPLFYTLKKDIKIGTTLINLLVARRPTLSKLKRQIVLSSQALERNITSRCYRLE